MSGTEIDYTAAYHVPYAISGTSVAYAAIAYARNMRCPSIVGYSRATRRAVLIQRMAYGDSTWFVVCGSAMWRA
eukprot:798341-Rhodomonas_salina.5